MAKRTTFVFFCTVLCGVWLISCTPKVPDEAEIVILSINDTHGDFENFAKFSAFVRETKSKHKNVIVVDAGDRFTGNPYNDFNEKREYPIIDLENAVGIDIVTIGNHEFDYGVELLNERVKESNCIEISANVDTKSAGLEGIDPYYIRQENGIKIAFLGLTNVDRHTGKPATLAERVADIQFYDPIKVAMKYRYLKEEAHVFVALTHIGVDEDRILADSMPELDVIIGGHSHTLLEEPLIQNNVPIIQAENKLKYVGKTTILLKKGVVSEITNEMINLSAYDREDFSLVKKVQEYENNAFLKKPFVTLQYDMPNLEKLGYAIADAALMLPNVDFSVMQCASIRIDYLSAGPVTYADVLCVYPFHNYLVVAGLKPAEMRNLIETEFKEKKNCLMLPAGFEYVAHRISGGGVKVAKMMLPNGKKLDEAKTYRVVLNSYLFSKYLLNSVDDVNITSISVVDNIVEYLKSNPAMDYRDAPKRAKYN